MKIALYHRRNGIHSLVKEATIPVKFEDVYQGKNRINEPLLIKHLPVGFCPSPISETLLSVAGDRGSTGQRDLTSFQNWAKYFDVYVIELAPYQEVSD